MERHHPHAGCVPPQQAVDALGHLPRRFVREGYGKDRRRLRAALLDEVRNAVREHAGFARTGAGDDQQWAGFCLYRVQLSGVESCERIVRHLHPT